MKKLSKRVEALYNLGEDQVTKDVQALFAITDSMKQQEVLNKLWEKYTSMQKLLYYIFTTQDTLNSHISTDKMRKELEDMRKQNKLSSMFNSN